jgi:prevent-host-death family protein
MSESLGVFDAKAQFSQLIDRAEAGEEIVITRHGRPVAKLGPVTARISAAEREAILKETAALRAEIAENGPPFDWEDIRAMRDEGRR